MADTEPCWIEAEFALVVAEFAAREKEAERKARHERSKRIAAQRKAPETPVEMPARFDVAADVEVPTPPFWGGTRIVKGVALADCTGLLDERALFVGQWGLRGVKGGEGPSCEELVEAEGLLAHAAVVYGYFPAASEGASSAAHRGEVLERLTAGSFFAAREQT